MAEPTYSEIVSKTIANVANRGVTYRRYGQHGELTRMMVHRWPAEKVRDSVPFLSATLSESNALFRALNRK